MATVTVPPATPVGLMCLSARFVEAGAGTYVANFNLPPGAVLYDIIVTAEALWAAATSAALTIGDSGNATGWLTSTNLKATDLLVGESISEGGGTLTQGGKGGAYGTAGTNTHLTNKAAGTAGNTIVATVTSVGAGTTGRTRVDVLYYAPGPVSVGP